MGECFQGRFQQPWWFYASRIVEDCGRYDRMTVMPIDHDLQNLYVKSSNTLPILPQLNHKNSPIHVLSGL